MSSCAVATLRACASAQVWRARDRCTLAATRCSFASPHISRDLRHKSAHVARNDSKRYIVGSAFTVLLYALSRRFTIGRFSSVSPHHHERGKGADYADD